MRSFLRPPFPLRLALLWTAFITSALWLGLSVVFQTFGQRANDIVLLGLTQVAVYALVLAAFGFAQQTPVRELLALKPASFGLCVAAAALGAALQLPAT